jgi:hypothetical protein
MKRTITATTICALLLGISLSTKADDTHLVSRIFAITPSNTASAAVCPNLLASDSIAVLTAPTVFGGTREFSNCDSNVIIIVNGDGDEEIIIDLRNTIWDSRHVIHVTDKGIVNYSSWWQRPVDDPQSETPPGIGCLTGPEGNVLMQLNVLISQAGCDEDPDDDGKWRVVETGGTRRFCIAFGLCNK